MILDVWTSVVNTLATTVIQEVDEDFITDSELLYFLGIFIEED